MMDSSKPTVLPSVRQYGFSIPQHVPRSPLLKTLRRRNGKMIVHESFVRLGKCRRYFRQSGFLFKLQRNTARHKRRVFNFCIAYGIFRCFCQSLLAVSFLSPVFIWPSIFCVDGIAAHHTEIPNAFGGIFRVSRTSHLAFSSFLYSSFKAGYSSL